MVLDAELVAVDRANGNKLRAFQELATRARSEVTEQQVGVATWRCRCVLQAGNAEATMPRDRDTLHAQVVSECTRYVAGHPELSILPGPLSEVFSCSHSVI